MLASPLPPSDRAGQQLKPATREAWLPADEMDCDDEQIRMPLNAGPAASVMISMAPSLSSHSISSSTSSSSTATTSNDAEPELSQSLGSVSSFDLRTPLKPSLSINQQNDSAESFNLLGLHKQPIPTQTHAATLPRPAASLTKSLLAEALAARKTLSPTMSQPHVHNAAVLASPPASRLNLSLTEISPKSMSTQGTVTESPSLQRANKPKLNLTGLSSSFNRPNFPQTPGGSLFFGARDGAATGAPVSPFLPPTPLVASMMEDEQARGPSSSSVASCSSVSIDEAGLSPSERQKRQSLPFAISTPRQVKSTRPSLQRHGSIGMSPLSHEFANVSVRGKSRSNEDPSSTGSPIPRRANDLSALTNASSPSKLLTPPYSPLVLGKSLPETLSSPPPSSMGSRRSSSPSSGVSSSSSKKLRAKESLLGGGADMSRSFSASRLKSSTRTKAAPKPFNLTQAFSHESSSASAVAVSSPQPLSAPAMKISFADAEGNAHQDDVNLDDMDAQLPQQMSPEPMSPEIGASSALSTPKHGDSQSDTPVKTAAPDASLLSPSTALRAPAMEKSFSAPLPPPTVSARHLADYELHPRFSANYTLGDELGSGGFGFVVAARRNQDGLPVAVKFIFKDKVPAHGWVRDPKLGVIPMEAFVLKVVDHPGVVKFIDLFDDRNFFYLVMELHGTPWQPAAAEPAPKKEKHLRPAPMQRRTSCDLFECIEQHSRLSEEQARWVFAQVVETVWHLDRIGICHRDIKDENCVVDADFNVKLIDFGSAVITDIRKPQPYFNRFFGTMTFASPEILQGQPYRAPHAEIWSLGVLLSILLSGQCPFPDPASAIKGRISKPKGAWSTDALNLLLMCLEVDPEKRATIAEIRDHPWVHRAWKDRAAKL
ncbi:kinase-like protein, partial [Testicularia cyperi]